MRLKNEDLATAREIMRYLEKHYQDRFDYGFLVQKFHINECKLKYAFKEVANDNIHSFLTKVRMDHAKRLLETTDHTIKHVAYKVGLDKSNFNIQFKKYTGKTPSQWRNECTSGYKVHYYDSLERNGQLNTQRNNSDE